MLRITLLSGDELTRIHFMELRDMNVKALKLRLHRQHGLPPRFRQRLLHGDKHLNDDMKLDSVIGLGAVPTSLSEEEPMAAAAERGSLAEGTLKRRLDPGGLPSACRQRLHLEPSLNDSFNPDFVMDLQSLNDSFNPDFVMDLQVLILQFSETEDEQKLSRAAARGRRAEVEALLQLPLSPDTVGSSGSTPLMSASQMGHVDVAQLLVEAGAQMEVRDHRGGTALTLAALGDHAQVVQLLLEAGCQIVANEGHTVLSRAVVWGRARIVQLLQDAGVPQDLRDHDGCTPLMHASLRGHAAVVQLLLEAGAQKDACDYGGSTSLMFAALYGHTPVVQLLLEAGAEMELRDGQGSTALMYGAFNGHAAVVQLLREAGADKHARDWDGKTALMLATDRQLDQLDEVRQLLGGDANAAAPEATAPEL